MRPAVGRVEQERLGGPSPGRSSSWSRPRWITRTRSAGTRHARRAWPSRAPRWRSRAGCGRACARRRAGGTRARRGRRSVGRTVLKVEHALVAAGGESTGGIITLSGKWIADRRSGRSCRRTRCPSTANVTRSRPGSAAGLVDGSRSPPAGRRAGRLRSRDEDEIGQLADAGERELARASLGSRRRPRGQGVRRLIRPLCQAGRALQLAPLPPGRRGPKCSRASAVSPATASSRAEQAHSQRVSRPRRCRRPPQRPHGRLGATLCSAARSARRSAYAGRARRPAAAACSRARFTRLLRFVPGASSATSSQRAASQGSPSSSRHGSSRSEVRSGSASCPSRASASAAQVPGRGSAGRARPPSARSERLLREHPVAAGGVDERDDSWKAVTAAATGSSALVGSAPRTPGARRRAPPPTPQRQ